VFRFYSTALTRPKGGAPRERKLIRRSASVSSIATITRRLSTSTRPPASPRTRRVDASIGTTPFCRALSAAP